MRDRVFRADNSDSHWSNGLMVLVAFAIASMIYGYNTGNAKGSIILFLVLAGVVVLVITGTLNALVAMLLEAKTERRWAGVEETRINAIRDVTIAQIETEQLRIETDATTNRLHVRLAEIERKLLADGASSGLDRTDNYVPNHADPAQVAVREFVASCYDANGFNSDMLYANGGMRNAAPWNSIWKNEPWRGDAEDIMRRYVLDGDRNQPHFRHATNADAQEAIPLRR